MDFKSLISKMDKLSETTKAVGKIDDATKKVADRYAVGEKQTLSEATKEIKTGRIHKSEPGGYGRKDDEGDDGKKIKPTEKRGRGRPKKGSDSDTGEVKKWDTEELARWIVGSKPKTLPGKPGVKHKLKDESAKSVAEAAKWRQGYSASGHPAGYKHKSGDVGPVGGTFTDEPMGYGDTKKVTVQKYRDEPDQLADRSKTSMSTSGQPLQKKNAQRNLKAAIKQSAGKHGPVGLLPEDDDVAEGENIGGERYDMIADLKGRTVDELNKLIQKLEGTVANYPDHPRTSEYLGVARMIRAQKIGKKGVAEGTKQQKMTWRERERLAQDLADWIYTTRKKDRELNDLYRAFEKKFGPNGEYNFGNYIRSQAKLIKFVLNHPKATPEIKRLMTDALVNKKQLGEQSVAEGTKQQLPVVSYKEISPAPKQGRDFFKVVKSESPLWKVGETFSDDDMSMGSQQVRFVSVKRGVTEGTKETKTGRVHKAEPGGYGRKSDEDEKGKKVKPEVKKGRGRPKKGSDSDTGEVKKYDTDTLSSWIIGSKPKTLPGKASVKHKLKDWMEHIESTMLAEAQPLPQGAMIVPPKTGSPQPRPGQPVSAVNITDPTLQRTIQQGIESGKITAISGATLPQQTQTGQQQTGQQTKPAQGAVQSMTQSQQPVAEEEVDEVTMTAKHKSKEKRLKSKYDKSEMKAAMKKEYGPEKGEDVYFATIRKQAMKESDDSKTSIMEGYTLEDIKSRFPHECKMCEDGWAMDESLYEALSDHYHKEGRIPYKVWHGPLEELRDHITKCYLDDSKSMIDEQDVDETFIGGALGAGPTSSMTDEGMGADIGSAVGAGVGSRFGPAASAAGSMAGGAIGGKIDDMLPEDDADFPFPDSPDDSLDEEWAMEDEYMAETKNKKLKGQDDMSKFKKDSQMENWDRQLNILLREGMTVTTSTGQNGMGDSVSVSATDEDAQALMKVLSHAGIGMGAGMSAGMKSADSTDGQSIEVEPMAQDEILGQLQPSDDNGDQEFGFLKRMIGARDDSNADAESGADHEDHACETCEQAPCACDEEEVEEGNKFTGELAKARADGVQKGEKIEVDGKEYPVKPGKKMKEEQDDDEEDSDSTLNDEDYSEDDNQEDNTDKDEDEEEQDDDADDEEEKVDESQQSCNECGQGVYEGKCGCGEKINEWANSRGDHSKDESFQTELDYLTHLISGGLNGQKRDQTTLPHTTVKTQNVKESLSESISSTMRKLARIK